MITFKTYFTEATQAPLDNWQDLLKNNDMLSTGVNLVREIEKLGGEALIVGGSVRDILLGKPIKDVDIATNVPLDKVKQHFKWNNIGQSGDFGITMIHYGGHEFEVANYRADSETSADNRRPDSVKMVNSFKDDSARRDITINSMGINSKGEIVDHQGGIQDIKDGIIRAVGTPRNRFTEDALRILRTARFASKYGFEIEAETKAAMKELSHLVDEVSKERVQDELTKISNNGAHLANYISHLDDSGQLERVLPEVKALQGRKHNPQHHPEGDAYEHTLAGLRASRSSNPATNIAILFHDLGKGVGDVVLSKDGHPTYHGHETDSAKLVKSIGKRLKFSNDLTDTLEFAAANHMKAHRIYDMSKKKVTKLVNDPNWDVLKDVAYADELSRGDIGYGSVDEFEKKMADAEATAAEISQGGGEDGVKKRLKEMIDGHKVMSWTGLRQGQEMGIILGATQDWLYSNLDASEEEVKAFVLRKYEDIKNDTPPTLEESYNQQLRSYNDNI